MKKLLLISASLFLYLFTGAQTFTSNALTAIPDAGPMMTIPIVVSGLSPANIDTTFGIETVCFDITHTYDADLHISLQAPDGTIVDLSISNGGGGDNFTGTCLNQSAANSIVTGSAPFTGTYRPQGFIGAMNNGQLGNGTWNLLVQDVAGADTGSVHSWSITFGNAPAHPFLFSSSNLPIVVLNTNNQNIVDSPNILAQMGIIDNGPGIRNHVTDSLNTYNNKILIQLRGSSSQSFPQKSYGLTTLDINGTVHDTIIMGMPAQSDWILYAPYDDKTCMRDVLTYDIANQTGHYASRTRFCELMLNGQYQGIYVMMEKIKRDSNRVSVSKLTPLDITGDELTGGYIIKIDRDDGPGSYWTSPFYSNTGVPINFVYVYPKYTLMAPIQKTYIQSFVDSFELALNGPNFTDPVNGYRKYIGVGSFIDYFLLNEVSKNVDGYRLSTFFHKEKLSKGGKLKAGPAWDYNLAWWNANYCGGDSDTGWVYQQNNICSGGWQSTFWWERFLDDQSYTYQLKCRWIELRQSVLSITRINNYVDSIALFLDEAQQRHFTVWPIIGVYTWPNPSPIPTSYADEITAMKNWIFNRITWMDAHLPGNCNTLVNENSIASENVNVYPNPFSSGFHLNFYLPHNTYLKIEVTDVLGKTIKNMEQKNFAEGENNLELNFTSDELKTGMYLLKIISPSGTIVKKVTKID